MNGKLDFKKIGIAIVAIVAIVSGLMRNLDTSTTTEKEQTQQTTAENESTQTVDFELNNEETAGKKDNLQPRNVEDDSDPGNQRITYEGKEVILTKHAK